MAGNNMFSGKDSMDITELASLNDDISPELIEQLQAKVSVDAKKFGGNVVIENENSDAMLFEEIQTSTEITNDDIDTKEINEEIQNGVDNSFEKKYQEKFTVNKAEEIGTKENNESTISNTVFQDTIQDNVNTEQNIETPTSPTSSITEKTITPEQKSYNDSLDFLDGNVKYSKYVIYVEPQNVDFIEGLTVKERKNLINKILREQDDIAITKSRFRIIQTVIKHAVVAILTIAISIPVIYLTINASLEASINNYRRSQTNFQVLYKEKGKITNKN